MLLAQAWSLLANSPLASFLLLAQQDEEPKQYTLSWGIVMFCILIAMTLTLKVSKREPTEDKPLEV